MNPDSWKHDMDDLIMEVTICQDEHRVDRSASLKLSLLTSNHTSFASRRVLIPPVRETSRESWVGE
ncbi:hypothetical protein BJV77DRAFT_1011005 [Russula vinacea]|nr:hypothetical protein BJV77DRAFT_1011005 [Russula vinacea]